MPGRIQDFWRYQFPAVAWGLLISLASSVPSTKIPAILLLSYDKVIHAIIFLVLDVLIYRAIAPKVRPMVFSGGRILLSIGLVVLYGAVDEIHQSFVPGRTLDIKDLCADAVGGLLGTLIIFLYVQRQKKRPGRAAA